MFDDEKYAILTSHHPRRGAQLSDSYSSRKSQRMRSVLFYTILSVAAVGAAVQALATDAVPDEVFAGAKKEVLKLHAEGVQIYECKADGSDGKWVFREPLATLLKDGKTVGRHFAGPSWELASGSAVVGKVEAQAPGKSANDIPLLKLAAAQKRGEGEFANVSTVQRLETHGGVFSGSCNTPGALHLEPYSAEYVFLGD